MEDGDGHIYCDFHALICSECGMCFEVYTDGVPLDEFDQKCECGSTSFLIEGWMAGAVPPDSIATREGST